MLQKISQSIIVLLFVGACVKKDLPKIPPERVVEDFITASASVKTVEQKKDLVALCTGRMAQVFEQMSDEAFKMAYVNQAISLQAVQVVTHQIDGQTAQVTYRVSLANQQGTSPTEETNERTIFLKVISGQWKIENIQAGKTDRIAFLRGLYL